MKIHMLYEDVNKFQMLAFEGMEQLSLEELTFDGRPRLAHWKPPGAFVYKPRLKRGNFLALGGCSTFVVDATAAEELADLLEKSGELLPLTVNGEQFYVVNVTQCFDVLDHDHTKWKHRSKRSSIDRFAFCADRLSVVSPLFKIPENNRSDILTIEGLKDPQDEFKARVEQKGLKGLKFIEIWSTEG